MCMEGWDGELDYGTDHGTIMADMARLGMEGVPVGTLGGDIQ